MCGLPDTTEAQPYHIVLDRFRARDGAIIETRTFAFAKVTELRGDFHQSMMHNFSYPIGKTVYDPNARINDHQNCLHFLPNAESAQHGYSDFGSHILIVLLAQQVWDPPVLYGEQPAQCWHSNGCTTLYCATCLGLTTDDLQNDECWRDLTKPRRQYALSAAANPHYVLPVPRNNVWYRQALVNPYQTPQYVLGGK